jgi:hypothetical protein
MGNQARIVSVLQIGFEPDRPTEALMSYPTKWRTTCSAAALALVPLLAGACASFPEDRMPKVTDVPSQARFANRPSVYVPLRFMVDLSGGEGPGHENSGPLPMLRELVEKTAKDAALFRSLTFESFQAGGVDHVLQLEILNYGSGGKAAAAGFITGITLFIVPTAATDNYKLTAKLFDGNGQLLKSYSYDDAFVTWLGIWLLPVAGNTPKSAMEEVLGNMIRTLFRDILKDDLLRYSRRGGPGLLEVQLPRKVPQRSEVVAGGEVVDQR